MARSLRVLVLVDSMSFGGAEHLLGTFVRHAPAADLEVAIASIAPRGPDSAGLEGHLGDVPLTYLDIPRLAAPTAVPRIAAAIRRADADVVHAHMEYAAVLGPPAAWIAHRPLVTTFHHVPGPAPRRERVKERLAVASADRGAAVLFVSEAARRAFAARHGEGPRWHVVHNGIDLTRFTPGPAEPPDDLRGEGPIVAMVAALRRPKGHADALRAWPQVRDAVPDARLVIAGIGVEQAALRTQAAALGIADSVVFAGARDDVPDVLRASALAVSASHTEALPTALIEAAACGVPVVATAVGGTDEVVEHGTTGQLVPPHDPTALAGEIIDVLSDHDRRSQMGLHARARAERRFDAVDWMATLRRSYDAALRTAGRSHDG